MSRRFIIASVTAFLLTGTAVRAEDKASLNARVCGNVALTAQERTTCMHEMQAARTDEDKAKVRKEYEAKIVDARARKSGN